MAAQSKVKGGCNIVNLCLIHSLSVLVDSVGPADWSIVISLISSRAVTMAFTLRAEKEGIEATSPIDTEDFSCLTNACVQLPFQGVLFVAVERYNLEFTI